MPSILESVVIITETDRSFGQKLQLGVRNFYISSLSIIIDIILHLWHIEAHAIDI